MITASYCSNFHCTSILTGTKTFSMLRDNHIEKSFRINWIKIGIFEWGNFRTACAKMKIKCKEPFQNIVLMLFVKITFIFDQIRFKDIFECVFKS
ncbi:hypothetical protein T03_1840 [Trichinella britovi]|uniref:Uncharacterized protein n=1 Tax=Trichinella britovi TaxID=45882 RepID=A0A0V1CAE1_TRIBR|nr:hypothetical protein T03_1840 [Trichinella britovi]